LYWTHWEQNPEFNKWYETKGKEFAKKSGYEVEVVTIPYQGYEAKYLAALVGKSAPRTSSTASCTSGCGQYDFCDKMPADLEKTWSENLPSTCWPWGNSRGDIRHPDRARQLPADVHRRGALQEGRAQSRQAPEDARRVAGPP